MSSKNQIYCPIKSESADKNRKPVAWLEKNPTGRYIGAANLTCGPDAEVLCAFKETSDGYTWEFAIPKQALPFMEFKVGTVIGLSLTIHDKDSDKRNSYSLGFSGKTNYRTPYIWKGIKLVN